MDGLIVCSLTCAKKYLDVSASQRMNKVETKIGIYVGKSILSVAYKITSYIMP